MATREETLHIEGMSCGHCVRAVRETLQDVPGVKVENVEIGTARVRYDDTKASHAALEEAIKSAGFDLTGYAA